MAIKKRNSHFFEKKGIKMRKTVVGMSIKSMTMREKRRFLYFVKTDYFNTRVDLITLSVVLFDKEINLEEVTKEEVFLRAFPEDRPSEQESRLLLSYLQKKIELFFTIEEFLTNEQEKNLLLLSSLQKRNIPKVYLKKLNYFRKKSFEHKDWKYFFGQYRLEAQNLELIADTSNKLDANYEVLTDKLDRFYLSLKLRHICTAILYHSVFNKHYEFPNLKLSMDLAKQEKYLSFPAISVYYFFIKVILGDETYFSTIKETLFANRNHFSVKEFQDIYKMILNFYIRNINEKDVGFVAEALGFYKKGLDLNLLIVDGYLSKTTYSNIVGMAIKEKELEWVGHFIENYKGKIRKKVRQEVYNLNRARLEYAKKNFEQSLLFIKNVNYKQFFPAVTARLLQIKIYWESDQLDLLSQHLYSLKYFIKRKKVIGYHLKVLNNTISYIQKLAEVNPYDKTAVNALKDNILQ